MNVLGCNDQFFNIFINMCVLGTSITMAAMNNLVPGRMGLNYFMCTGEDQRKYDHIEPKVSIFSSTVTIVESISGACDI